MLVQNTADVSRIATSRILLRRGGILDVDHQDIGDYNADSDMLHHINGRAAFRPQDWILLLEDARCLCNIPGGWIDRALAWLVGSNGAVRLLVHR